MMISFRKLFQWGDSDSIQSLLEISRITIAVAEVVKQARPSLSITYRDTT
jgi:hypothetical protein